MVPSDASTYSAVSRSGRWNGGIRTDTNPISVAPQTERARLHRRPRWLG